jgi:hypothetical protein
LTKVGDERPIEGGDQEEEAEPEWEPLLCFKCEALLALVHDHATFCVSGSTCSHPKWP